MGCSIFYKKMKARKARKKKEGAQEAKANKYVSREGT